MLYMYIKFNLIRTFGTTKDIWGFLIFDVGELVLEFMTAHSHLKIELQSEFSLHYSQF